MYFIIIISSSSSILMYILWSGKNNLGSGATSNTYTHIIIMA